MTYLINKIDYPPTNKDLSILEITPMFCSINDMEIYRTVIDNIMNILKRVNDDLSLPKNNENKELQNVIEKIIISLIDMNSLITQKEIRFDLLKTIITRFIQLGGNSKNTKQGNERKEIKLMEQLLCPISLLIKDMEDEINKQEMKTIRLFWFNCVLAGFVDEENKSQSFYKHIKTIATYIPPFIMKRGHVLTETISDSTSVLNKFHSTESQKGYLDGLLKKLSLNISSRQPPGRILMYISIYYLEILRCSNLKFDYITDYIDDSVAEDEQSNYILQSYPILFKSVFTKATDIIKNSPMSFEQKNEAFTNLTSIILSRLTTANTTLYTFVEPLLKGIISILPSILYSKRIFSMLLHIVETISKLKSSNPLDIKRIPILGTQFYIETPESATQYADVTKHVMDFATFFLDSGFKQQPQHCSQLLHSFTLNLPNNSFFSHAGIKLALDISAKYIDISTIMFDLFHKASSLGMTIGKESQKQHCQKYVQQLKTFNYSNKENENLIRECVAYILINNLGINDCYELLNEIVYSPMKTFTIESIQMAIPCWEWLISVSPISTSNYFLKLIENAWKTTIENKLGLFNDTFVKSNPLSRTIFQTEQSTNAINIAPHEELIKFFFRVFSMVQIQNNKDRLNILYRIVLKSISHDMINEASSVGTRFILLLLGLKIIQFGITETNNYSTMILKIINAGLKWFENAPDWFECSRTKAELDVETLVNFNRTLIEIINIVTSGRDKRYQFKDIEITNIKQRTSLLLPLVGNEIERICVWNNPMNLTAKQFPNQKAFLMENIQREYRRKPKEYILIAWDISPALAIGYYKRFSTPINHKALIELILAEPARLLDNEQAHVFIATPENVEQNIPQLNQLLYWETTDPPHALNLLKKQYNSNQFTTLYALRVLDTFDEQTVLYYVPQLVQSLRYDKLGLVESFIIRMGKKYQLVAHQLIWNCDTYSLPSSISDVQQDPEFVAKLKSISQRIVENYDEEEMKLFQAERDFVEKFTEISGNLIPLPTKEARINQLREKLGELTVDRDDMYVPTNPNAMVVNVSNKGCACLRSAAKVPILVNMTVKDRFTNKESELPVIFKSGDDIRSDMLAVQMIELFDRINKHSGLDIYLCPYHIIATGPDKGIIEVVRNSISRDQMGEKYEGNMYNYYLTKYGGRNAAEFFNARANFIKSMSAYAIVCYLLQIKDRHNGNILIDEEGHLIHIDFGFMFDSSPGGDLGFEKSPFKLTDEMISIMGGSPNAEQFIWFMEQGIKSFLSIREYYPSIITLVELMLDTQMKIFKPPTIQNLTKRFCVEGNYTQAAMFCSNIMKEAFSIKGTFFTYFYDKFQQMDNGISM